MIQSSPAAEHFFHGDAPVIENVPLARDTYRIRLECPALAQAIRPGQFLMLRLPNSSDPLLARPFALYDTTADGAAVDVVYLVIGKLTGLLATLRPTTSVEIWG